MYETLGGTALRGYNGTAWGTIQAVDDSKTMQRVDVRGLNGETFSQVERPQNYGETSVPLPPDGSKAAEVAIGFRGGNRSHPFILATDDRRYRMKNLKPGERASHDDQGQSIAIRRGGIDHVAQQHTMSATSGSQPLTTFELQEQLKGLGARMSQTEHSHHALFDVTSRFREIVQGAIPAVAEVAPILNQDPTGLPIMAQAIEGKVMAYLQQHIQDALTKFTSPIIGGVGSILGGADTIIAAAEAEIASLLAANPVVATFDGLVQDLANLNASGSPSVVAVMAPTIQGLIDSATASNPVIGQVAQLRTTLAGLVSTAGDGLNFLAPQQRMVQGLTRSLKLSQ